MSSLLVKNIKKLSTLFRKSHFLDKYDTLVKRVGQREIVCVHLSNVQLAALEIIDDSQNVEIIDRDIDYDNAQYCAENKDRLRQLLNHYYRHPQPGEHDHRRACCILRLHLNGHSERAISHKLNIAQPTVHQYIIRTIKRLKAITLCKYYRGA